MNDWKEYKLGDCINFVIDNRGKKPPISSEGYELIETASLSSNDKYPDYNKVTKFVSKDTYNNWFRKGHPKKDDILISTVGAIGNICIMNEDRGCIAQNLIGLRVDKSILSSEYLFYFLSQKTTKDLLTSLNIGSVQPSLKVPHLLNIKINVPRLDTQHKITSVLSKLDNKIHLNTQTNQTLEAIAQAIFKSWFVDFDPVRAKAAALAAGASLEQAEQAAMTALSGKTPDDLAHLQTTQPEQYRQLAELAAAFPSELVGIDGREVPRGWEINTLEQISGMQNGYAFKSTDWVDSGLPVIKIGSVKPMIVEVEGNGFVSDGYASEKPDYLLKAGDIVVGLTGYVGEVGRIPQGKSAMLNQRVAKFLPKTINLQYSYYNYIYCLARQSAFKQFAELNAKGSAQANISTKEILKYPIIRADNKTHKLFEKLIQPLLDKILVNSADATYLANVRDSLLPKLLNGDIVL